jgi:hypothetical protein
MNTALFMRLRTSFVTIVLVVVCFVIILQASIYKTVFSNRIPKRSLCETTVPELYLNGSSSATLVSLVRPPAASQGSYDAQCQAVASNTFYAIYGKKGLFTSPAATYAMEACVQNDTYSHNHALSSSGLCPTYHATEFCPCISTSSSATCYSAQCPQETGSVCVEFAAETIGACYCYDLLSSMIKHSGVVNAMNSISTLRSGECGAFFKQYSVAAGLTYVSVGTTTAVNVFLRKFLKTLATLEARTSSDAVQGSIMTKIFLSNFATMAIIVLVAYGSANNLPSFFKTLHIFNGPYKDFSVDWYGNIGFYLMTTFIIQSFSPLLANIVSYLFIKPVMRWYHHRQVR